MNKSSFFKSVLFVILFPLVCLIFLVYREKVNENFDNAEWWKRATPEQVEREIARGAYINGFFCESLPFDYAVRYNQNPEVIEILIKNGADVNGADPVKFGNSPLMIVAEFNQNPAIIETLIKHNADVNAKGVLGVTALMYAAKNENPEVIETLIKNGADVNARDNEGRTVLDYAKENPKIYNTETYKHLQELVNK